jgi:hypothetical protein
MPNFSRCDVLLLNDNDTPMEFVVIVLERFFGMPHGIAVAYIASTIRGKLSAARICAKKPRRKWRMS